jgi:hypothetical protein
MSRRPVSLAIQVGGSVVKSSKAISAGMGGGLRFVLVLLNFKTNEEWLSIHFGAAATAWSCSSALPSHFSRRGEYRRSAVRTLGLSVDRLLCVGISGFASSLVSTRLPASVLFSWLPQSILPYSGVLDVLSNSFFVVDT